MNFTLKGIFKDLFIAGISLRDVFSDVPSESAVFMAIKVKVTVLES